MTSSIREYPVGVLNEEVVDYVVVEVAMLRVGESCEITSILNVLSCRDTQMSCIAARVWQSHPRHADLKEVSRRKCPSTQKFLAGPSGAHPTGRPSFPT
jgi:hypothetical protein